MSGRDPFSSPRLENDLTLSGIRPQQKKSFQKPTHMAQRDEPWSRLHDRATMASTRRSVTHHERQAPNDSLDFQLKSVYDHNKDFFPTKTQVFYQKETQDHSEENNHSCEGTAQEEQADIRVWVDHQRRSIHSIK
ncbi:cilia- and flagella-associated protein 276 [Cynoglossus semilaevis]|uniref:Chromosome 10 C1orf194 homolog n=1 Tax=Cynoglossus semilaevis TaxID=244447 RepID=A0A3P8UK63_CYNSE|nr:uncharacterized protein C1orf194 homolog [Cynoglossus semilaevis]